MENLVIKNGMLTEYAKADGDVIINDRVTHIGRATFKECYSLISITIPNGIQGIEQ